MHKSIEVVSQHSAVMRVFISIVNYLVIFICEVGVDAVVPLSFSLVALLLTEPNSVHL